MVGFRKALEVLPAAAACGVTFAVCQWSTATYLGPYLPDILSSLSVMGVLVLLLKVWRPRSIHRFDHDPLKEGDAAAYTSPQIARAWVPYIALTAMVLLWGQPAVKAALGRTTVMVAVPGLDNAVARVPVATAGTVAAVPSDPRPLQARLPCQRRIGRPHGGGVLGARLRHRREGERKDLRQDAS